MNFSAGINTLADYVNEVGNAEIIKAIAGSAPSIQYFAHQSGVNEKTALHLLNTTISFKNGKGCSFADSNAFSLSDRYIVPAFLKAETAICTNDMLGKWIGYEAKVDANGIEIPFEQAFVDGYREAAGEELEEMIWMGSTELGYKGLTEIVKADGTKVEVPAGSNVYDKVHALIMSLPSKSAKNTELFISPVSMLKLKDELLKKDFRLIDLEFTNGAVADEHTIKMPVFGTLIHEVDGITDENVYALVPEHTVYGYSVDNAQNEVKLVKDDVNDRWIFRIKMCSGVQVAIAAETLWATVAAA